MVKEEMAALKQNLEKKIFGALLSNLTEPGNRGTCVPYLHRELSWIPWSFGWGMTYRQDFLGQCKKQAPGLGRGVRSTHGCVDHAEPLKWVNRGWLWVSAYHECICVHIHIAERGFGGKLVPQTLRSTADSLVWGLILPLLWIVSEFSSGEKGGKRQEGWASLLTWLAPYGAQPSPTHKSAIGQCQGTSSPLKAGGHILALTQAVKSNAACPAQESSHLLYTPDSNTLPSHSTCGIREAGPGPFSSTSQRALWAAGGWGAFWAHRLHPSHWAALKPPK